jgi:hypothetical protein
MTHLAIQLLPYRPGEVCALCNEKTERAEGAQLSLGDGSNTICRRCGVKHAPSLVALLDLATTADRVGRIGRHTISPPLSALLELARAAEDYTYTVPQRLSHAA